ncbi:MarR family winged helix-turn-helix transcriptional regulator [Aestuariispira insulae]|uniref:DNA-binding MarR family transcriptional regulator n=1 Tax=Aestuariispira insulae TaxID=1461337 RepID=A0A3D9HIH8_9PROT|nr:MarR family transcriptional regulator [Aestuariispira insulae]RED49071.1 DNA-binding MarR family transcriptional regulator [Aestuariispira insulae]
MKVMAAENNNLSLSKQRLRLWLRMLRASKTIENEVRERLKKTFDVTLPRFDVLAALYRHPEGLTMTALSRDLEVSNGNVTGIVDRLTKDGFVLRVPIANDRRATTVQLTPKGKGEFEIMAEAHESWIDEMMESLNEARIDEMIAVLEQLKNEAGGVE